MKQIISRHIAIFTALLVVAIWGETFVSSKILIMSGLMPADIFFCRFLIAYACIWIISHKRLFADNVKDEFLLCILGILGGSVYFLTENMALVYSPASNVAILVGSTPLVTALLLALFYKDERMNAKQILGSVIAFAGMALVVLNGQLILHLNPTGDILALSASLSWGFYSLVIKKLATHYDTAFITRKVFFYGLISIIPYFLLVTPFNTDLTIYAQPKVWANILYLGLIASMACYVLWNWCLKKLGTVRATNILYIQSMFTMIAGNLVLSERITIMAISGAVILVLGMAMMEKK